MNQTHRRSKARAIARTDESRTQKALALKLTVLAVCAVAALFALPSLWSF